MKEFKVNEYITLKLENGKTAIYVERKRFLQCKYLLLGIPVEKTSSLEDIESIDEAEERLDKSLERIDRGIPPEVEFWGHCSNLQVWDEYDYNTRLLHRNLAFPLLKRLVDVGDPRAIKALKDQIAIRFMSKYPPVMNYLCSEGFLNYLENEELETILLEVINDLNDEETLTAMGIMFNNNLKKFDKAIECYQKALEINPRFSNAWFGMGATYFDLKLFKKAIICYKKTLKIDPKHFKAWNDLGCVYSEMKLTQKALKYYEKSIKIEPNQVNAWNNMGILFIKIGLNNKAFECYKKAIEVDPRDARVWSNLRSIYISMKSFDKAKECYNRALEIDPEYVAKHNEMSRCLKKLRN